MGAKALLKMLGTILKADGSYARNEWEGSYYLKSNGKMANSEWIFDQTYQAWYYLKGMVLMLMMKK